MQYAAPEHSIHVDAPKEPEATAPNPSYVGVREDMLALLPEAATLGRVLEVGCAEGATGATLKARHPAAQVTGIELDPQMATRARERLDRVIVGDACGALGELVKAKERFDVALCGDVLEHLADPWDALRSLRALCPDGHVVVSLPNVAHLSTIASLVFRSRWPYRDRGIHDRTHLRFFGRANLAELYDGAGFVEVKRKTHHRLFERPHGINETLDPIVAWIPILGRLAEYQFVSLLEPLPPST